MLVGAMAGVGGEGAWLMLVRGMDNAGEGHH